MVWFIFHIEPYMCMQYWYLFLVIVINMETNENRNWKRIDSTSIPSDSGFKLKPVVIEFFCDLAFGTYVSIYNMTWVKSAGIIWITTNLQEQKMWLVRENSASRIKCMIHRVIHQIRYVACVNIRKSKQSSRKIRGIVVCSKHTAELFVEHTFGGLSAMKIEHGINTSDFVGYKTVFLS